MSWGYTRDVNADLSVHDTSAGGMDDTFQRVIGGAFTPPFPADPSFNGVYFFIRNWKGEGPFDPFGSMGWAQWVPKNDPKWRNQPEPVAILPDTPEELNRQRVAAEQAAARPATSETVQPKTVECISKTTFKKKKLAGKHGKKQKCPKGWVKI